MLLTVFKSKIHRARVTDANLYYEGSIEIDEGLLRAANIVAGEKVQVVNVTNGARFETYVLRGKANSGIVCLNGAAARLGHKGDEVIIITYAAMSAKLAESFVPEVVLVDEDNRIVQHQEAVGRAAIAMTKR